MVLSSLVLLMVIAAVAGIVYWTTSNTVMMQTRYLMEKILEYEGELPSHADLIPVDDPFLALSEEALYETRYFVACVRDEDIEVTHFEIAIRQEDAARLIQSVCAKRADYGKLHVFSNRDISYMRQEQEDGSMMIVVLDSTSRYSIIRIVMTYMSGLWFFVLLLYITLMSRYSQRLIQPFVENDERQKRFITNASHELKTPLAVISANTEMTEVVSGKTKWTESTRRQISKLQSLIEDLVVLSRLDEMEKPALTEMDLSQLTGETVESFRSVIESSGKELTADLTPGLQGKTEQRSFQQLVSILMDNAAKYCDDRGVVRVQLIPVRRGKGIRLTVSNTYADGRNVDYSRFFERFYREDASHNSSKAGFGIGLSMGKEIAERLGGAIRVRYTEPDISFEIEL